MNQHRRSGSALKSGKTRPQSAAGSGDKPGVDGLGHFRSKVSGETTEVLDEILRETRRDGRRSRQEMIAAREQVHHAEVRIRELEAQLAQLAEAVREDSLTGSLNRRGLNDMIERELARSTRRALPLSVAKLDLEDLNKLDAMHGPGAADHALVHLARVAKTTLRMMDVIGRFDDDALMILLPDTNIDNAMCAMSRLQRELAKQILIHRQQRLPIAVGVGVATRHPNEDPGLLIKRADTAMLKARKAGSNQAVAAE